MNETELITRILSGEENLFAELVNRHCGHVWAICLGYVRNRSDCEDVAQEVFIQCYRRLDTLRDRGAFGQWLSQLARRHCLGWLRASGRRRQYLALYEEGGAAGHLGAATGQPEREEMRQNVRDIIAALPPDHREALLLCYVEGCSAEESAALLGISAPAMRKRLERARGLLKARMWRQMETCLAEEKHDQKLVRGILAAVPFGSAPWLGATGAGTTAGGIAIVKTTLIGGVSIMSKKMALGLLAGALVLALTAFTVHHNARPSAKAPAAQPAKSQKPSEPARAVASNDIGVAKGAMPPATPAAAAGIGAGPADAVAFASVAGYVDDQDGRPLAGADIWLEMIRDRQYNDVVKTYTGKTGSDGKYSLPNIDIFGTGTVFAGAPGHVMQRTFLKVFEGKKTGGVNLTLPRADFNIGGRVVDEKSAPVPGAMVDVMYWGYDSAGLVHTALTGETTGSIGGARLLFAITDQQGSFTIAIPGEGLCDFRVSKPGYGAGFFPKVATGTVDARFVLHAGGAITGKVTKRDGTPLPGTPVNVVGSVLPGGMTMTLSSVQTLPSPSITATTDAQGVYLAEGLGADYTYKVQVPAPKSEEANGPPDNTGREQIASMMRDFEECSSQNSNARAEKKGIRVTPGETTRDVDLVVGEATDAFVYGVVTDRTSGQPACPVVVVATSVDGGGFLGWSKAKKSISAVTRPDGSYRLQVRDAEDFGECRIGYVYMTEGGSVWDQPDEEIALFALAPGEARETSFSVDGPVTVPVRYVDVAGNPLEGISAGIREAAGGGSCGGMLVSDGDGRVVFHGIRPSQSLQARAFRSRGGDIIGVSDPFSGQPGEMIPEVTVVCRMPGGAEGVLVYSDGRPVANRTVSCEGRMESGPDTPLESRFVTDENGGFNILSGIPEGVYLVHAWFFEDGTGALYEAAAEGVEIVAGSVTSMGTLVAEGKKDWKRIVQSADYGRKGNELIAENFEQAGLENMNDPGLLLKAGMAFYDVAEYQEALDTFARMAENAQGDTSNTAVARIWQGQVLDLMGRRDEAVAAYAEAAALNAQGNQRHDQFGLAYNPTDYARERMEKPFVRVENNMP